MKNNIDSIKEEKKKKSKIQSIAFLSFIVVGLIINTPNSSYEIGSIIGGIILWIVLGFILSTFLTVPLKGKNNPKYNLLSSIGYGISLLIFIVVSINNKIIQNDNKKIINSININENGIINIPQDINLNTEPGKKLNDFMMSMTNYSINTQKILEGYENIMYREDVLESYENLKKSVKYHNIAIKYLEEIKGESITFYKSEYEKIYGFPPKNTKSIEEKNKKEILLTNKRILLYKKSKKLYNFYLENYSLIGYENGELSIGDKIYDEYKILFTEYENEFNSFEKYRQKYIQELQNKLK